MTPLETLYKETESKMQKTLEQVEKEFREVRGGRATPALVENLPVDYYGTATPVKQLAAVTAPEARMLVIQPWDNKAIIEIEKAIQKASLGVTPVVDGKVVRVPIPPLTGERRDELVKVVHKMAEEGRVAIRSARRDANESVKKLKNNDQATEDDVKESQTHVQKITDSYIEKLNGILKTKEDELHKA